MKHTLNQSIPLTYFVILNLIPRILVMSLWTDSRKKCLSYVPLFIYVFTSTWNCHLFVKAKANAWAPPSTSCISLSINCKITKLPQTENLLPCCSILTFPWRQTCLFFREVRRGFAAVLTFCIIFFLLHLEKKEKKRGEKEKKAQFWNDSKNALLLWSDVDCICLCRLLRGTTGEFFNPWCLEEPYIDKYFCLPLIASTCLETLP